MLHPIKDIYQAHAPEIYFRNLNFLKIVSYFFIFREEGGKKKAYAIRL